MHIKYADIVETETALTVKIRKDPFLYDVRVFMLELWLPMFVASEVFMYAITAFRQPDADMLCEIFLVLWALIFGIQLAPSYGNAATWTVNRCLNEIRRNGNYISKCDPPPLLRLETKYGWLGNRRFRLLIHAGSSRQSVIAEVPLLENGYQMHQYFGQTFYQRSPSFRNVWKIFQGEKDAIDPRDGSFFELAQVLEKFLIEQPSSKQQTS